MKRFSAFSALLLATSGALTASTTFTNGATDSSWSNPLNWSNGVPDSTVSGGAVIIGTQPSGDLLGLDTGVVDNRIYSLSLTTASTYLNVVSAGVEQLGVLTHVTIPGAMLLDVDLPFAAISGVVSALNYATGGGLYLNAGFTVGAVPINATGSGIFLEDNQPITMELAGTTLFGAIQGSAPTSFGNAGLQLNFGFTPVSGQGLSFDLFGANTGDFSSVSFVGNQLSGVLALSAPGVWTGTVGGENWSFTESSGLLVMVPEPASGTFLALGALFLARRRLLRSAR
ncbi:MAG TPA: hypothetical protein VF593_05255 [Chthoniobacteraceae bacterium]|jgi:hypothetical protein